MVEFWGAIAKIRVKLKVTRHGIPRVQKVLLRLCYGIGVILFGGLEYFGPKQYCGYFAAAKYIFSGTATAIMLGLSMRFVYTIYEDIMAMQGTGGSVAKEKLAGQLKLKFSIFFVVTLGFVIYSYFWAGKRLSQSPIAPQLYSNWKTKYEFPIAHVLFVLAIYTVLFQFTNIHIFSFCNRDQRVTDQGKDASMEAKTNEGGTGNTGVVATNFVVRPASINLSIPTDGEHQTR